jgi:hypothetical protein
VKFPNALLATATLGLDLAERLGARLIDGDGIEWTRALLPVLADPENSDVPEFLLGVMATWEHVQEEVTHKFWAPLELPFMGADHASEYFVWVLYPDSPVGDFEALMAKLDLDRDRYELKIVAASPDRPERNAALLIAGVPVAKVQLAGSGRVAVWPWHSLATFPVKACAVLHVLDAIVRVVPGRVELGETPITPELRTEIERHIGGLGVEFWIFSQKLRQHAATQSGANE